METPDDYTLPQWLRWAFPIAAALLHFWEAIKSMVKLRKILKTAQKVVNKAVEIESSPALRMTYKTGKMLLFNFIAKK